MGTTKKQPQQGIYFPDPSPGVVKLPCLSSCFSLNKLKLWHTHFELIFSHSYTLQAFFPPNIIKVLLLSLSLIILSNHFLTTIIITANFISIFTIQSLQRIPYPTLTFTVLPSLTGVCTSRPRGLQR